MIKQIEVFKSTSISIFKIQNSNKLKPFHTCNCLLYKRFVWEKKYSLNQTSITDVHGLPHE